MRTALSSLLLLGLAGCANRPAAVVPATAEQEAALLERVKSLEGVWVMEGPDGSTSIASEFKVSSNGSVVREVMFPGQDHEMTNIYHMDGGSLVMTHYCAIGNQPRLRARSGGPDAIDFQFDSVTNLTDPDAMYMGSLRLVFVDGGRLRQEWTTLRKGVADHHATFEMTRQD